MSDGGGSDLAVREIAGMLDQQAATLAPMLLPNGRVIGPYLCVGSVEGEPGDSLKVHIRGNKIGKWSDYSRDQRERGGSGDMLSLVELVVAGGSKAEAVQWAKRYLGIDGRMDPGSLNRLKFKAQRARERAEALAAQDSERMRRWAEGMWQTATTLEAAPPALAYFAGRGIDFAVIGRLPGALRFRGDVGCRWFDVETGEERHGKLPCVVSAMIGPDGRHMATHGTFLDRRPDGSWTNLKELNPKNQRVRSAKRIFGPYLGAHIPLNKGACRRPLKDLATGVAVECSEGIEDGLSVAMGFPEARVIAAGTLGNIGQIAPPRQAGDFVIVGQNDKPGSPADESLQKQIRAQQVRAAEDGSRRVVRMRWPLAEFKDFNDQLRGMGR